jgi:hypothetical protein
MRCAYIRVSKELLPHAMGFPSGTVIAAVCEEVQDPSMVLMRVEGDSLPECCEIPKGARLQEVAAIYNNDGFDHFERAYG